MTANFLSFSQSHTHRRRMPRHLARADKIHGRWRGELWEGEMKKNTWVSNPDAILMKYIQAIESIFGTSESRKELYFSFRSLRQQPGEHLSEFLWRIDGSLIKVAQGGGISVSAASKCGLGSTYDLMLLRLKVRERRHSWASCKRFVKKKTASLLDKV